MKLDEDRERLVLLEQILEQDLPHPPAEVSADALESYPQN